MRRLWYLLGVEIEKWVWGHLWRKLLWSMIKPKGQNQIVLCVWPVLITCVISALGFGNDFEKLNSFLQFWNLLKIYSVNYLEKKKVHYNKLIEKLMISFVLYLLYHSFVPFCEKVWLPLRHLRGNHIVSLATLSTKQLSGLFASLR